MYNIGQQTWRPEPHEQANTKAIRVWGGGGGQISIENGCFEGKRPSLVWLKQAGENVHGAGRLVTKKRNIEE